MSEDRMSAHRFRWLAGMLAAVIALLLWQNFTLRSGMGRLHKEIDETFYSEEEAMNCARQAKEEAHSLGKTP